MKRKTLKRNAVAKFQVPSSIFQDTMFHVSHFKFHSNKGFTVVEIILVLSIVSIVAAILIANFAFFQKRTELDNGTQEFVGILKSAQNKTVASDSGSQYGVYVNPLASPNQYTLFKGASYASRDTSYDRNYFLPNNVEFYAISLGGGSEVVFNKLTGATGQPGSVSLRDKTDAAQNKTVYISNSGVIDFNQAAPASDANRIKDSRHVHVDYSRTIDVTSEIITLTFNGTTTQVIPISSYLVGSELKWEGTINVGGTNQVIKVNTHMINNPGTQFSIHRDRRFNDKTLVITISGDNSGSLANYSADGLTTTHTSIYVSNFNWQ